MCTRDALRELATPGLLAVLAPVALGVAIGYALLGTNLAGVVAAGVLMAIPLAESASPGTTPKAGRGGPPRWQGIAFAHRHRDR